MVVPLGQMKPSDHTSAWSGRITLTVSSGFRWISMPHMHSHSGHWRRCTRVPSGSSRSWRPITRVGAATLTSMELPPGVVDVGSVPVGRGGLRRGALSHPLERLCA